MVEKTTDLFLAAGVGYFFMFLIITIKNNIHRPYYNEGKFLSHKKTN